MIINANSSGQGWDVDHELCPGYRTVQSFGYEYSHSTPVNYHGVIVIHHTFKRAEHNVCLKRVGAFDCWETSVSCASSRRTTGHSVSALRDHLQRKSRRYPELRKVPFYEY